MCCAAEAAGENIVQPGLNCNWDPLDGWQPEVELTSQRARSPTCQSRKEYYARNGYTYGGLEHSLNEEDLCFEDFRYAVLLREPVARMTSHAAYEHMEKDYLLRLLRNSLLQTGDGGRLENTQNAKDNENAKVVNNYQVRILAGVMHLPVGAITSEHVNKAKERLKKFTFVGTVDELKTEEGRNRIMQSLNWNEHSLPPHKFNAKQTQPFHFTEQEKTLLRQTNEHDVALYEWATSR